MQKHLFLAFMYAFLTLLEAEYTGGEVTSKVDYEGDTLRVEADDLMICSRNGHGQFLLGTITGSWAYLTDRDDVEGAQPECQGRKDAKCIMVCAPLGKIKKYTHMIRAKIRGEVQVDSGYAQLNTIKKLPYAKNSLKDLLQSGFIRYDGGFFRMGEHRQILNESNSIYLLEKCLGKLPGGTDLLFETTRKYFTAYAKEEGMTQQRVSDVLPALGWGDFTFRQEGVFVHAYPYSRHYRETTFPIIRGMLSGLLSNGGKQLKFTKAKPLIADNELQLDIRA
jgi:hypothetical protein